MGILLIAVICIIIGFILFKVFESYNNCLDLIGFGLIIIGACTIIICSALFWDAFFDNKNYPIEYEQNKIYIESTYNNDKITDQERTQVIKMILDTNKKILTTKLWRDNFWIGNYYPYSIGDLPIFDITKIKPVTYQIDLKR
ncbi:MAG: hypothetical protein WC438_05775 [Candidatus Pacearchaeota archaeon]|jgi:hypothetical protein